MRPIFGTLVLLVVLGLASAVRGADKPFLALDARGHTATMRKVVFTPEGRELISVSEDKTVRLWDIASGDPIRTLRLPIGAGDGGNLYAAALSPNGEWLAVGGLALDSGADTHPIYLISLPRLEIVRLFNGHDNSINDLAFSTDGRRLISGSGDETARVWRVADGVCEFVIRGHTAPVYSVVFAPDGQRCATAALSDTAAIWSVPTDGSVQSPRDAKRLAELRGHRDNVRCMAWRPDGLVLATGSWDQTIRLWSPEGKAYPSFDKFGERPILSVAFTSDSRRLLFTTGGIKGSAVDCGAGVFDPSSGKTLVQFDRHSDTVLHGALSRDGKLAATCGANGEVFVWQTSDGSVVQRLAGLASVPFSAAWSPDGNAIAWGNKNQRPESPLEHVFEVTNLAISNSSPATFHRARMEQGDTRLKLPGDSTVEVLRGGQRQTLLQFTTDFDRKYNTVRCATLLFGDRAAVGSGFGLSLFDTRTGQLLRGFQGHGGSVWAVSTSPDGRYLLSAGSDMTLRIWDPDAVTTLSIAGIGAGLKKVEAGIEIVQLVDGPAKADGRLKVGDIVTAVDPGNGNFTETKPQSLKAITDMVRGEVGTRVRLKVRSADGEEKTIALTRGGVSVAVPRVLPLLSLFFAGDDWIAWTPEGYYAASPGGEKLMGWHVNNGREQLASFYPASQFRSTLYRPDVIKLLLKTGSVDRALQEADTARGRMTVKTDASQVLPPQVRITSPSAGHQAPQNEIEVRATATSVGNHPITALRLLLDGRPYQGLKGVQTIADSKPGEVSRSWTVELEPGKHKLKVLADSAVSQGVSDEIEVIYIGGDAGPVRLPKLYVVAVGISEYPGELKLNYAAKDAEALGNALKSHSKSLFRDIEVQTITDAKATRADVLKGLSWLRGQMTQSDYGIFFFAGHGDLDNDGSLYFLPVDGDSKDLVSTAVPADQVKRVLSGIPGKLITMLDACHSAGIAGSQTGKRRAGQTSLTDDLVRDLVTDENGVIAMCSSTGREFSLENNQFRQGSFTLAVVEGLSGKADFNKDGVVYLNELDTYVTDRVKELTKGQQHPVTAKPGSIRSFPLAKP